VRVASKEHTSFRLSACRARLRLLYWSLGLFAAALLQAACLDPPSPLPEQGASADGEARFELSRFRLVEDQGGSIAWEVRATTGKVFEDPERAHLQDVVFTVRRDVEMAGRNGPVEIRSKTASFTLEGPRGVLDGGIAVRDGTGGTVHASVARYDGTSRVLDADGPVSGSSGGVTFSSDRFSYAIDKAEATFEGGVRARFKGWAPYE
jgi:LPS export ABC transporter protein LptC